MRLPAWIAVGVGAAGTALAAYVVLFGGYDISATDPHLRPTVWLLETTMRNSVRVRAAALEPPALDDAARIARGAALYRRHCEQCHGAPGVAPEPFALGFVPLPANLAHTARTWPARWIFWTVKNGIKMTGMPAWEYRLHDDEIWSIVAFLPAMARMTPAQYAALEALPPPPPTPSAVAGTGDPGRGQRALHQFACPTCHEIPGVAASMAPVGPPLAGIGRRAFIAGVLPNTDDNMVRWLRAPQQIDPRSAMPTLGLGAQDAADIAAFLRTLDQE